MRIILQPAFILHSRLYRETSLLLDILTHEHGRISLVARGVRSGKMRMRSILQPFVPLLISLQGQSELKTLVAVETIASPLQLRGDCLLSGFYLNELLMRSLQKEDPHPELFDRYQETLNHLQGDRLHEKFLRLFERKLLSELGYALPLEQDWQGLPLESEALYLFYPEQGFKINHDPNLGGFKGRSLQAFASGALEDSEALSDAKRLIRLALFAFLGLSDFESRKLFQVRPKCGTL